jgi:DNA-binding CsgD family transcriptional regulator
MKFCSLIKANLDADEIADILQIGMRGVEQKRHRVRKKLGLEWGD